MLNLSPEIDFIPNPSFGRRDAGRKILGEDAVHRGADSGRGSAGRLPKDLPAHLARLCEADLLSAEEERRLFRQMNYLKYRANLVRAAIDPEAPDAGSLEEMEDYLAQARTTRDRIVRANMRLVISIVKKFVTPQYSFDELLSEGIVTLMQAVDKFDYDRGFRFSTYAYRSIARHAYRSVTQRQQENSRFVTEAEDAVFEETPDDGSSSLDERAWHRLRGLLTDLLHRLDKRERLIIRARFALGAHRNVSTFQSLADRLGISKERVRQLEQRAMMKLRNMAAELDFETHGEDMLGK
jgi:RNA polymerase primary sigma factor